MGKKTSNRKFYAADLFAGGGGLTVGLKAQGFRVVSAVEIDPHACATYVANHPEVEMFHEDISTLRGRDIIKCSPSGKIDLLAGCPPCQGFTSLTYKSGEDPRNKLILEMGRLVKEIKPQTVMMENVPGLASRGKRLLNKFLRLLDDLGYVTQSGVLQVADYGIPQQRRRFVLVAGRGFDVDLPEPTHSRTGKQGRLEWIGIKDVISNRDRPVTLANAKLRGGPEEFNWHVVRSISDKNRARLKHAVPGKVWTEIPESLRPKCHQGKYRGFTNVYGRMTWNEPSPTITGGCTTLSKGRFGHPSQSRTISVREAALLQTFPEDYIIKTPYMEQAANIVGNALPCDFASVVAEKCKKALRK